MTKITDLEWEPHMTGERAFASFPNGYRASVLRGGPFYTRGGTYEIGVMDGTDLVYGTPVSDDVLGYLSESEANEVFAEIEALPPRPAPAA